MTYGVVAHKEGTDRSISLCEDCSIAVPSNTTYFDPKIKVNGGKWAFDVSVTLSHGQCKTIWFFVAPLRFCARLTAPGIAKYPGMNGYKNDEDNGHGPGTGDNAPYYHHGNKTGTEGFDASDPINGNNTNPRTQICVFEDMWDFGEGIWSKGHYHLRTPKPIPGFLGDLSNLYNLIVNKDMGCIDIPVGPLPPVWKNDEWIGDGKDFPEFSHGSGGSFFDVKTKARICREDRSDRVVIRDCNLSNTVDYETLNFTTNAANNYEHCRTATDGRTLCARITSERREICLIEKVAGREYRISCLDRIGYMPNIELEYTGTVVSNQLYPKVEVTFDGGSQTIVLEEDPGLYKSTPVATPGWDKDCKDLEGIKFCTMRPCETYNPPTSDYMPALCTSEEFGEKLCVTGYADDNIIAVDPRDTSTTPVSYNQTILGYPNRLISGSSLWVYDPPQCFRNDSSNGKCLHYAPCRDGSKNELTLDATDPDFSICSDNRYDDGIEEVDFHFAGACCSDLFSDHALDSQCALSGGETIRDPSNNNCLKFAKYRGVNTGVCCDEALHNYASFQCGSEPYDNGIGACGRYVKNLPHGYIGWSAGSLAAADDSFFVDSSDDGGSPRQYKQATSLLTPFDWGHCVYIQTEMDTWYKYYSSDQGSAAGNWVLQAGNYSVLQTINTPEPAFYVSPKDLINVEITGSMQVVTGNDDDMIGFVLGFQGNPGESTSANNGTIRDEMILFTWKQNNQGNCHEGWSVMDIYDTNTSSSDTISYCRIDSNNGSAKKRLRTVKSTSAGWIDHKVYEFKIIYTSDFLDIELWRQDNNQMIVNVNIDHSESLDSVFKPGRFGYYNSSQDNVKYNNIIIKDYNTGT